MGACSIPQNDRADSDVKGGTGIMAGMSDVSNQIDLGGAIYISSRRASEITGYAQDYIGQLARSGQIDARRVSGLWYVLEDSLKKHKERADEFIPQPPKRSAERSMEASVAFDGRDYVSAQRASKLTGYTADYVAQLAREDKVPSRQVGNRWYVDREELLAHKKEKDSLLAAVQSDSVGLAIPEPEASKEPETGTHFSYLPADEMNPVPTIDKPIEPMAAEHSEAEQIPQPSMDTFEPELHIAPVEEENAIPIRVVGDQAPDLTFLEEPAPEPLQNPAPPRKIQEQRTSAPKLVMLTILLVGIAGFGLVGTKYLGVDRAVNSAISSQSAALEAASPVTDGRFSQFTRPIAMVLALLFAERIDYERR